MAKFSLRSARSIAAGILITIGGCSENPTTATDAASAPEYQRVELQQDAQGGAYSLFGGSLKAEKVIGPAGGTLTIPGGHSISFPEGALAEPTTIKAKIDTRYIQVDLDPHGIQFPAGREPTLSLSYAGANLLSLLGLTRLHILYVSESGQIAEVLRTSNDNADRKVEARLSHFSRYIIGAN